MTQLEKKSSTYSDSARTIAAQVIHHEVEALLRMADQLGEEFTQIVDIISDLDGKVIITGIGKSFTVGHKIATTLASTGTPSFSINAGEANHGDLGMISKNDLVVAISNSGESEELKVVIEHAKRLGAPLVAITSKPSSALGSQADFVLKLPEHTEACQIKMAPTTSTTMTMVLGDALANALMDKRGFTKTDYGRLHPGGKLGKRLKLVRDLMRVDPDIPTVSEDTLMADAFIVMSEKMLGCVGVINDDGRLTGIFTDGDLRRHMGQDLLGQPIKNIMTHNPKTIAENALAVEAVAQMNEKGITTLFVIDNDSKPTGIIHIHDCLRAGIA